MLRLQFSVSVIVLLKNSVEDEVVLGNYQRHGSRSCSNKMDIKEKDFVLIRYPSTLGTYRYGRVIKKISDHRAKILILRRKSEGTGKWEPQVMDTQYSPFKKTFLRQFFR